MQYAFYFGRRNIKDDTRLLSVEEEEVINNETIGIQEWWSGAPQLGQVCRVNVYPSDKVSQVV